jgi:hypothetical protein
MMKSVTELKQELSIDLTGPQGNAFYLIGMAEKLAKQLDLPAEVVLAEMTAGDYETLVETFEGYFGSFVTLYR